MFLILLTSLFSQAHIVGNSQWCLANSPFHFECFFMEEDRCNQEQKRRAGKGEPEWQCVPFPMDFRNIPKTGEGPVATTTSTTSTTVTTTTTSPTKNKK